MKISRLVSTSSAVLALCTGVLVAATPSTGASKSHDSASATSADAAKRTPAAATRQILFFMNPNGHPCQMQLSILDGMKEKLSGLATVKYVKTTEPGDREMFYTYGIRGLPLLVILDARGKEVSRFTPGVQDAKSILAALTGSSK